MYAKAPDFVSETLKVNTSLLTYAQTKIRPFYNWFSLLQGDGKPVKPVLYILPPHPTIGSEVHKSQQSNI